MSTTITRAWTDASMDNNTQIQNIDERTGESIQNVRERLLNGGHKVTVGSTDAKDGVHYTGSHNYGSSSVGIWNDGITTRNLEVTNTQVLVNASSGLSVAAGNFAVAAGTISASGTGTFAGSEALTKASAKRLLVLTGVGRMTSSPEIGEGDIRLWVPPSTVGTVTALYAGFTGTRTLTLVIKKRAQTYSGDPATGTATASGTSDVNLGTLATNGHYNYTTQITNASVTGGEVIWCYYAGTDVTEVVTFSVVIALDW